MSNSAMNFLEKNHIPLSFGMYKICRLQDINQILDSYQVACGSELKNVCVRDILGFDYHLYYGSSDFFTSFCHYFDDKGDSYHSRDNGMLQYSSSEMVERLQKSFEEEPISVKEMDDTYFISINGLHRFHILKCSYLGEISKCKTREEMDEVDKKFVIPVKVSKIDIFKSYCNFLLHNFSLGDYWFYCDGKRSDLCEISYSSSKVKLTDYELVSFIKERVDFSKVSIKELDYLCQEYPSFKEFMDEYFMDFMLEGRRK